jgi:hypothetical protein
MASFSKTNFNRQFANKYIENDFYLPHRDTSYFTYIVVLCDGNIQGDLHFPQSNTSINCVNNRMIFFPSHYLYSVNKVNGDGIRYGISHFWFINGFP